MYFSYVRRGVNGYSYYYIICFRKFCTYVGIELYEFNHKDIDLFTNTSDMIQAR